GAFLSIMLPPMSPGEAAQFPTSSHAWVPPADADALEVSDPAATLVNKLTSRFPAPEPPSMYRQCNVTSPACHNPSALSQPDSSGAFLPIMLPPMSPGEAAQFPTSSHAWVPPADADASEVSHPAATLVDKRTSWFAGPEPPSM